uniref:Uncharacterized protein n=1 Tax=Oryza barthii TaxID=65489 RepID=A0A0D3FV10_9ORYZ
MYEFLVLDVELLRSVGVRGGDGEGAGGECGTAQREGGAGATLRDGATEKDSAREKRAPRPSGTIRRARKRQLGMGGYGGPRKETPTAGRHDAGCAEADAVGEEGVAGCWIRVQARPTPGPNVVWCGSGAIAVWLATTAVLQRRHGGRRHAGAARLGSALAVRDGAAPSVQQLAATRGSDGARGCRQRLAASSSWCSAVQGIADGQQFFVVMWPAQSCVCSVHATETNRVTASRASVRRRRTTLAALQHGVSRREEENKKIEERLTSLTHIIIDLARPIG